MEHIIIPLVAIVAVLFLLTVGPQVAHEAGDSFSSPVSGKKFSSKDQARKG